MGEQTNIEWCDHTFNPWIGCTNVSPACDNCYAEELMANRYGRVRWGAGEDRVRTSPGNWRQPLKWNRDAAAAGTRPFVFCASLADVFDNAVDPAWRADLFTLIEQTPDEQAQREVRSRRIHASRETLGKDSTWTSSTDTVFDGTYRFLLRAAKGKAREG